MSLDTRNLIAEEIRKEAQLYSGKDVVDLDQKIGDDLGIDDLDFYDFLKCLGERYGIDLLKELEIRAPQKVKPWSIPSIINAFRQPGLVEDPTLEKLVELIIRHRDSAP